MLRSTTLLKVALCITCITLLVADNSAQAGRRRRRCCDRKPSCCRTKDTCCGTTSATAEGD
ncbi:MAG: hypothetical protein ACKVT0_13930, partial [Planctomycetaceae bacterium]